MTSSAPVINLVHLPRVTSTMDVLDELIAAGAPEWTVVMADEQTAGLGRAGRSWEARTGSSLLCSILVRPRLTSHEIGMVSIAVGVALARYLETLGVCVSLKWPNDVLLDGRKLAGILIRTRHDSQGVLANVGIGLNLAATSVEDAGRASLDEAMRHPPDAVDIVTELLSHLARTLLQSITSELRDAWMSRATFIGEMVHVEDGGRSVAGRLIGIDDRGALLIEGDGGERLAVVGGDLVRGPRVEAG